MMISFVCVWVSFAQCGVGGQAYLMTTVVLDSGAVIGDAPAQTDKCGLVYLGNVGALAVHIVPNLTKESDIASSDTESDRKSVV